MNTFWLTTGSNHSRKQGCIFDHHPMRITQKPHFSSERFKTNSSIMYVTLMVIIRRYINYVTQGDLQGIQLDQVNQVLPVQENTIHFYKYNTSLGWCSVFCLLTTMQTFVFNNFTNNTNLQANQHTTYSGPDWPLF